MSNNEVENKYSFDPEDTEGLLGVVGAIVSDKLQKFAVCGCHSCSLEYGPWFLDPGTDVFLDDVLPPSSNSPQRALSLIVLGSQPVFVDDKFVASKSVAEEDGSTGDEPITDESEFQSKFGKDPDLELLELPADPELDKQFFLAAIVGVAHFGLVELEAFESMLEDLDWKVDVVAIKLLHFLCDRYYEGDISPEEFAKDVNFLIGSYFEFRDEDPGYKF
jgi:hypothetical protein